MGLEISQRYQCDCCGSVQYHLANDLPKGWSIIKVEATSHKYKDRQRFQYKDLFKCPKCKNPSDLELLKKFI